MSKSIYGKSSINLTVDSLSFLEITTNDITTTNASVNGTLDFQTANGQTLNVSNFYIDDVEANIINANEINVSLINGSTGNFDNIDSSLNYIQGQIDAGIELINDLSNDIAIINSSITIIDNEIIEINSSITDLYNNVSSINGSIDDLQTDVANIYLEISDIDLSLNDIDLSLNDLQNQINNLDFQDFDLINVSQLNSSQLNSSNASIQNLEFYEAGGSLVSVSTCNTSTLNASSGTFTSVQATTINGYNASTILATVLQNEADIESNTIAIADLNTSVVALENDVSNLNTCVSNLNTSVSQNASDIDDINTILSNNNISFSSNNIFSVNISNSSLVDTYDLKVNNLANIETLKVQDTIQMVTNLGSALTKTIAFTDANNEINVSVDNISNLSRLRGVSGSTLVMTSGTFQNLNVSTIYASNQVIENVSHINSTVEDLNCSDLHCSFLLCDTNASIMGNLYVAGDSKVNGNLTVENAGNTEIRIYDNTTDAAEQQKIVFENGEGNIWTVANQKSGSVSNCFKIANNETPSVNTALVITPNTLRVGLGSDNPQYKLHVVGDIFSSSSIITPSINSSTIDNINSSIDFLQSAVLTNAGDITSLENTITNYNVSFSSSLINSSTINTCVVNTSTLHSVTNNVSTSNISTIYTSAIYLNGDDLESQIITIEGDIATIESDISTIESNILTLDGDITTIQGEISTLNSSVNGLETTISGYTSSFNTSVLNCSTIQMIDGGGINIEMDNQSNTNPGILVTSKTLGGHEADIVIQGRTGGYNSYSSRLYFKNYDNGVPSSNTMGYISSYVRDYDANLGSLRFFSSSNGTNGILEMDIGPNEIEIFNDLIVDGNISAPVIANINTSLSSLQTQIDDIEAGISDLVNINSSNINVSVLNASEITTDDLFCSNASISNLEIDGDAIYFNNLTGDTSIENNLNNDNLFFPALNIRGRDNFRQFFIGPTNTSTGTNTNNLGVFVNSGPDPNPEALHIYDYVNKQSIFPNVLIKDTLNVSSINSSTLDEINSSIDDIQQTLTNYNTSFETDNLHVATFTNNGVSNIISSAIRIEENGQDAQDNRGLIVSNESTTGQDSYLEIRGNRNGLVNGYNSNLIFSNNDIDNVEDEVHIIGQISGRISNAVNNYGYLSFFSNDGTLAEELRVSPDVVEVFNELQCDNITGTTITNINSSISNINSSISNINSSLSSLNSSIVAIQNEINGDLSVSSIECDGNVSVGGNAFFYAVSNHFDDIELSSTTSINLLNANNLNINNGNVSTTNTNFIIKSGNVSCDNVSVKNVIYTNPVFPNAYNLMVLIGAGESSTLLTFGQGNCVPKSTTGYFSHNCDRFFDYNTSYDCFIINSSLPSAYQDHMWLVEGHLQFKNLSSNARYSPAIGISRLAEINNIPDTTITGTTRLEFRSSSAVDYEPCWDNKYIRYSEAKYTTLHAKRYMTIGSTDRIALVTYLSIGTNNLYDQGINASNFDIFYAALRFTYVGPYDITTGTY